MKFTTHRRLAFVLVLLLALVACQEDAVLESTGYNPEDDMYIMINGWVIDDVTSILPAKRIGELAFDLQEGTHESITDVSGAEIDHYYIWVCLGDACIPVDPARFSR